MKLAPHAAGRLAVGLYRVSTVEQGQSGLVLEAAHRLMLEVEQLRDEGIVGQAAMARALIERGVATPRGSMAWTHTTVARVLARAAP